MSKCHDWLKWALVGLFVLLGGIYSVVDPIFEASDEIDHYPFVAYLAQGHGLPVQDPARPAEWHQEGSQPPLYYALAAVLTGWIDTGDLPEVRHINPHARKGIALATDNKNMVIHSPAGGFPWRGTALAVHLIRFFSVLLGAGTLLCTYALARELYPHRPWLAYRALAMNAFLPMFIFISASVNNDNLVVLLSSLALLLMVRLVTRPAPVRPAYLVGLGLVIGLACLTKLGALGLLPLAAFALALRETQGFLRTMGDPKAVRGQIWPAARRWLIGCLAFTLPALLVAGWWFVRNWQLYGDPTGLNAMLAIAGRRDPMPSLLSLANEFQGFRINFWGLFGAVNVLMRPTWIYRLLDVLSLLALAGLGYGAWRARRRLVLAQLLPLAVPAAWIAVEFVALIRWTSLTMASQGRLMFPAISAICLFFTLGLIGPLPARSRPPVLTALAAGLFILAATAPFTSLRPAYQAPPLTDSMTVPDSAQPVNLDYGGVMRLLAYEVDQTVVRPGQNVRVTLYWQSLAQMDRDFSVFIQLFGAHQPLANRDTYPGRGAYRTSTWQPGQFLVDSYDVEVRPEAQGPAPAWLIAGLYELDSMERLAVTDTAGNPVVFPILTRLKLDVPHPSLLPEQPLRASFEKRVELLGYDLPEQQVHASGQFTLTLYWQSLAPLAQDYTVFVHLVGEDEQLVGQGDAPPLDNFYPTSQWQPGEIIDDIHKLEVKASATPGAYRIFAGFYEPATGRRLAVVGEQGQIVGDRVLVATVRVEPPP